MHRQQRQASASIFTNIRFSKWSRLKAQLVKNLPAMQETPIHFLGEEDPLERDRLPTPVFLGFPGGSAGKESVGSAGDMGSIPGLGSPGECNGYPLQYSGLENSMDSIVHGVAKSWTGLSDFHFRFPERIDADCLRKETNGSTGKTESKETVFLPFPCTLGARVELLF